MDEPAVIALRRLASRLGQFAPAAEVFEAVTAAVGQFSGADLTRLERYEADGTVTAVAGWSRDRGRTDTGTRYPVEDESIAGVVRRTRCPARLDGLAAASGPTSGEAGELGIRSSIGVPITVGRARIWGVLVASTVGAPFPPETESRIAELTEIVATAVPLSEGREERGPLAKEQAALRRVATLVARAAPPREVFAAVTYEVCRLFDLDVTILLRFEPGNLATYLGGDGWIGAGMRVGDTVPIEPSGTLMTVLRTGRSAQSDIFSGPPPTLAASMRGEWITSRISVPIIVEGRVWGVLGVGSRGGPMPPDTEQRLVDFTELVGTAISNAESRVEVRRLLDEQAALRRVATLVASGPSPVEVCTTVAAEVSGPLGADVATVSRFEPDGTSVLVATFGDRSGATALSGRWGLDEVLPTTTVWRTGRSARSDADRWADAPGDIAGVLRKLRVRSMVASPVVVEGRLWGAVIVTTGREPLPPDTEDRLANFTELVAMAIGNAESRTELAASRARIVAAADQTRRRIERDLHDGAQQRLVSLGLELRLARSSVPADHPHALTAIDQVLAGLTDVLDELREMSRGIHPAILSEGGLGPALKALARRSTVPVELDVRTARRFPEAVEVAAYYVVSEALANTTKHAGASHASVVIDDQGAMLLLSIRDDGVGGADPARGSGLVGLRDRVEALSGSIEVISPSGQGTSVHVTLPVRAGRSH